MVAEPKRCASCGNEFMGRANAMCCGAACRQRLRRRKRDAPVTVTAPAAGGRTAAAAAGHTPAALAVLAELDRELAENAEQLGQQLVWSASERLVLDMIADAVDRRQELLARWQAADDDKAKLKAASELRLTEQAVERLLRRVSTELPPALTRSSTRTSERASKAARRRWDRRGY